MNDLHSPQHELGVASAGNSRKRLVLLIGAVVIALGAGAAAFMVMSSGDSSAPDAALTMAPPAADAGITPAAPAPADMPPPSLDAATSMPEPVDAAPVAAADAPLAPMAMPAANEPVVPTGDMAAPEALAVPSDAPAPAPMPGDNAVAPAAAPAMGAITMGGDAAADPETAKRKEMCTVKFNDDLKAKGKNPDEFAVARDSYVTRCMEFIAKQVPQKPAVAPAAVAPAPTPATTAPATPPATTPAP